MEFADINVESVSIIIKKQEKDLFDFCNSGKEKDGFVLFDEGNILFFRENKDPVLLKKGTLVLLRKGDRYRFRCDTGCTYITAEFSFSPNSEDSLKNLPSHIPCPKELRERIAQIETLWQNRRWDRPTKSRILLLELYTELLRKTRTLPSHPGERIAERAKEYIHLHFKENFSIAQIAAACKISPSHLRSVFEQETGTTVMGFRNRLRIDTAKEMLTSGLFSIKETAAELGYCDIYHFSKSFKQATGIAPTGFKRR